MAIDPALRPPFWAVQEELITLAAPLADQVRIQIGEAVENGDVEALRREGNAWSGHIGLAILRLSDEVESHLRQAS